MSVCDDLGSCIKRKCNDSGRIHWMIDKEIPIFKNESREYIDKLIYVGE